jgi:hypothetical protein
MLANGGIDSGVETENDCSNDVADLHSLSNPENRDFACRKDSLDTPPPPAPPTSPEVSVPPDFLQLPSTSFGLESETNHSPRFPHQPSCSHDIIINIESGDDEDTNDGRMNMDENDTTELIDSCSGSPYGMPETPDEDEGDLAYRPFPFPSSNSGWNWNYFNCFSTL